MADESIDALNRLHKREIPHPRRFVQQQTDRRLSRMKKMGIFGTIEDLGRRKIV